MSNDWVGLVEAIYGLRGADHVWLTSLLGLLRPHLGTEMGLSGYFFDARAAPRFLTHDVTYLGFKDEWCKAVQRILDASQQPDERTRRVRALVDGCGTATEVMGHAAFASMPHLSELVRVSPIRDFFGMVATDPGGLGCVINAPLPTPEKTHPKVRQRWSRICAHIATAMRLRRAARLFAGSGKPSDVEAVFAPSGAPLHLEGGAERASSRVVLQRAVRQQERARLSLRHLSPEQALSEWQALVAGRWTLVDDVETVGRRVILARRNSVSAPALPQLSAEQAQVVGFAALGHSNKLIAYELGIQETAVGMRLTRACHKLGVRSRTELIATVRRALGAEK
jgi:DNA-binding CsgD family transcriptional regulator